MNDILAERAKTHGDYYDTAAYAQHLKEVMRKGKNWSLLDDAQRETLEMVASKIGRILAGNPHEADHWRDIAGYAELVVRALTACSAAECGPTRRLGAGNPASPSLVPGSYALTGKATRP